MGTGAWKRGVHGGLHGIWKLPLYGPARLEGPQAIRLQRKGLALLYYLALEGPSRREILADLLWGHPAALQNLRVELYRIQEALGPLFPERQDPLELPPEIVLDTTPGEEGILEGLEQVSEAFAGWLQGIRSRLAPAHPFPSERKRLLQEALKRVRIPGVLILVGRAGSGHATFAQELAQALRLPLLEGGFSGKRTLNYLRQPYPEGILERILSDREGLWVLERSSYGEDPKLLLELRSRYPAEQVCFFRLPPLSFEEARQGLLASLEFRQAAQFYLASGGNPGHLQELLSLKEATPPQTPQRIRAQVQLEARLLSMEARLALERLAVHPGPMSQGLIEHLDAASFLDEYERRGWLIYRGQWCFAEEAVRRVLYQSLQPGRRQSYHQQAALQCALEEQPVAEAYHRTLAGGTLDWGRILDKLSGWQQLGLRAWLGTPPSLPPYQTQEARLGRELLFESNQLGEVFLEEGRLVFYRDPTETLPSGVEWSAQDEPTVLHLQGQTYLENPLGIGISGQAVPLLLRLQGAQTLEVLWTLGALPGWMSASQLVLPLEEPLDAAFLIPKKTQVSLLSWAESGVFDLEVHFYRLQHSGPGPSRTAISLAGS